MQTISQPTKTHLNGMLSSQRHELQKTNQNVQERHSDKDSLTLSQDKQGQSQLSKLLLQCYDALRVYGKEPEQLENLNMVFQMVLERFTFVEIYNAFKTYLERHTDMPTPADIVSLIEPPNPSEKLSMEVFRDIRYRQKTGQFITTEEEKYLRLFLQNHFNETVNS